jgi:hypothetical protein
VRSWCKVGFWRSSAAGDEWWGDCPATQIKNGESRVANWPMSETISTLTDLFYA